MAYVFFPELHLRDWSDLRKVAVFLYPAADFKVITHLFQDLYYHLRVSITYQ